MKKNHPERSEKSLRKSTVRRERNWQLEEKTDRIDHSSSRLSSSSISDALKTSDNRKNRYSPIQKRLIIILALVLVLIIIIPLSCRLLPSDQEVTPPDCLYTTTENNKTEKETSDLEQPSTESSERETDSSTENTSNQTEEEPSNDSETDNTSETDDVIDNRVILPELKNWTDEDIFDMSKDRYGWSFNRPAVRDMDLPAILPAEIKTVIEPFAVLWQLPPVEGTKKVYITMDEGYEYKENTTQILNVAKQKDISIAFFITGDFIRNRPDLVKRMVDENHQIANHTVSHPDLAKLFSENSADVVMKELTGLEEEFYSLTGEKMLNYIRPPMGTYSAPLLALFNREGYYPVFWSFAYVDWETDNQPEPQAALDQILGELHDGSIILLHAVSETNVAILPDLIDGIRERGYTISPLP